MQIPIAQQIRMLGIVKKAVAGALKVSPSAANRNPTPKIRGPDPENKSLTTPLQQMKQQGPQHTTTKSMTSLIKKRKDFNLSGSKAAPAAPGITIL